MAKVDIYPAFTASGVQVTSAVGDGPVGVRFEWPDGHALFTDLPEQGMYLDACDGVGGPVAIVTGHDTDTAYLVTTTGFESLAKTHGIRACAVNIVSGSLRWVFVHNTTQYVDTGEVKPLPPDQIQTSQGILALEPSGRINWAAPPDRVEDGLFHKVNAGPVSAGLYAHGDQLTVLDNGQHTLFNGLCHNIRIVARTDGKYGVCARNEGSPIFAVGPPWPDFIEPSEPLPPLESVPLLNRKFGLACYCFNDAESSGNLSLPIRPGEVIWIETPIIATTDFHGRVLDIDLWAIYSGESPDVPSEQAVQEARLVGSERKRGLVIYQDSYPMRESVMALSEDGDILAPQVYRNQHEDLGAYRTRLRTAFIDGSIIRETWPTVNIHQRYSGETPTLSVHETIEGFITACQIAQEQGWPGMVLFRVGTPDVPDEIYPYVQRFLSGITGTPEARILEDPDEPDHPDEPEEPDMAAIANRLNEVFKSITEIAISGSDKVALELPDLIHGKKKIKCTTPDGKDEYRPKTSPQDPNGDSRDWAPNDIGPWESYGKTATAYTADRDGKVYVYPRV